MEAPSQPERRSRQASCAERRRVRYRPNSVRRRIQMLRCTENLWRTPQLSGNQRASLSCKAPSANGVATDDKSIGRLLAVQATRGL